MARYLYRTCPKCKDYLGVVVPEPPEPVTYGVASVIEFRAERSIR
jgi:hypothetical protein